MIYQLDPKSSWTEMLNEANRWIREGIGCRSVAQHKGYWVSKIKESNGRKTIVIKREEGHSDATLGFDMVNNFLMRFEENNSLSTDRKENRLDKAQMTVIVNLHSYLSFSDDLKSIIILDERKIKIAGSRPVDNNSLNDQQRSAREIRQGQPKFRYELLNAYFNTCCITGTGLTEVLDAAHIEPYSIDKNNKTTNGLLLRADIHNLFDIGLIKITPRTLQVKIDKSIKNTEYGKYHNCTIKTRMDGLSPNADALRWHYDNVF